MPKSVTVWSTWKAENNQHTSHLRYTLGYVRWKHFGLNSFDHTLWTWHCCILILYPYPIYLYPKQKYFLDFELFSLICAYFNTYTRSTHSHTGSPGKWGIVWLLTLYATPTLISANTSSISSLVSAKLGGRGDRKVISVYPQTAECLTEYTGRSANQLTTKTRTFKKYKNMYCKKNRTLH